MTQIDFFSNAPNRIEYVARLLQKVQKNGQTAVVFGEISVLESLSTQLWAMHGMLAHDVLREMPNENTAPDSAPFILTPFAHMHWAHHQVLINLSDEALNFFAQFERLIEVVPNEAEPKQKARDRWQVYKDAGYVLKHHDIAKLAGHHSR